VVKVADEEVDSSSCRSGEEGFAQNLFDGRGLRVHVGVGAVWVQCGCSVGAVWV